MERFTEPVLLLSRLEYLLCQQELESLLELESRLVLLCQLARKLMC